MQKKILNSFFYEKDTHSYDLNVNFVTIPKRNENVIIKVRRNTNVIIVSLEVFGKMHFWGINVIHTGSYILCSPGVLPYEKMIERSDNDNTIK